MEEPRLLENKQELTLLDIKGLAYIKDSEGKRANLELMISTKIATETNEVDVKYFIRAFYPQSPDYVSLSFDKYADAVIKYNELAIKFNGYR